MVPGDCWKGTSSQIVIICIKRKKKYWLDLIWLIQADNNPMWSSFFWQSSDYRYLSTSHTTIHWPTTALPTCKIWQQLHIGFQSYYADVLVTNCIIQWEEKCVSCLWLTIMSYHTFSSETPFSCSHLYANVMYVTLLHTRKYQHTKTRSKMKIERERERERERQRETERQSEHERESLDRR